MLGRTPPDPNACKNKYSFCKADDPDTRLLRPGRRGRAVVVVGSEHVANAMRDPSHDNIDYQRRRDGCGLQEIFHPSDLVTPHLAVELAKRVRGFDRRSGRHGRSCTPKKVVIRLGAVGHRGE